MRRERPRNRRAAKRENEFSPSDVDCHVTHARGDQNLAPIRKSIECLFNLLQASIFTENSAEPKLGFGLAIPIYFLI
jgi:hypothetical protein